MKIFAIMGKVGAGKDSIRNLLMRQNDIPMQPLVNFADRPPRPDEQEGVNHFFMTKDELDKKMIEEKPLFVEEWPDPFGGKNRYAFFTPAIDGIYVTTCALSTYVSIKENKDITVLPIFLIASGANRLKRAVNREGNPTSAALLEICRRFIKDEEDYHLQKIIEAGINRHQCFRNDDSIQSTLAKVRAYILSNTIDERRDRQ